MDIRTILVAYAQVERYQMRRNAWDVGDGIMESVHRYNAVPLKVAIAVGVKVIPISVLR